MLATFMIRWLVLAAGLGVAAAVVDGVEIDGGVGTLLLVALGFGLVNALIRPLIMLLALPIRVANLGVASLAINGLMFLFTDWASGALDVGGLVPAIIATVLVSIVSTVLNRFIGRRREAHDPAVVTSGA